MRIDRVIRFFTSLRLTVVCLGFAIVLVFFGTLAQVDDGLFLAQSRWFRSFFVWWGPHGAGWEIPVFPGGYLIGGVLLINLIAAHIQRFKLKWSKLGIHLTHAGIILLLVGQLATDILSRETHIHFIEGETRNYTESSQHNELVFLTASPDGKSDETISIPASFLKPGAIIRPPGLPVAVHVKEYHPNTWVHPRAPMIDTNTPPPSTNGVGPSVTMVLLEESRDPEVENVPGAIIELVTEQESAGNWVVAPNVPEQEIRFRGKPWRFALRRERFYLPYSVKLLKTTYAVYAGTDIPKDFQSRVQIDNPTTGEDRQVDIYMNNPLRYQGQTFYQYQMGRDQLDETRPSTLMVVKNPGWVTPYAGCLIVGAGMVIQFLSHLLGFISKRKTA